MLDVHIGLVAGGKVPSGPEVKPEIVRIVLCQRRRRHDRADLAWRCIGAGRGLRCRIGERADHQRGGLVHVGAGACRHTPGVRIGVASVRGQTPHRASPRRPGAGATRARHGAIADSAPAIDRIHAEIKVVIDGDGIRHKRPGLPCIKDPDSAARHIRIGS